LQAQTYPAKWGVMNSVEARWGRKEVELGA
jgi:hypothetical protein